MSLDLHQEMSDPLSLRILSLSERSYPFHVLDCVQTQIMISFYSVSSL